MEEGIDGVQQLDSGQIMSRSYRGRAPRGSVMSRPPAATLLLYVPVLTIQRKMMFHRRNKML